MDTCHQTGNGRFIGCQNQHILKRGPDATTLSASEALAGPSQGHSHAGAHQQIALGTRSTFEDQFSHPEASAAAHCLPAEPLRGSGKHGQAAGAEAQALHTLAARILGAKCVQQAMQTVQTQHAKRARQAAKLKAQPGQASAPGEGRRQRSRKRKLEGVATALRTSPLGACPSRALSLGFQHKGPVPYSLHRILGC